jgi:putative CocE/NonD family hydrolase
MVQQIQTDAYQHSEIRNGMRIDWNTPIAMDDGIILRADIFRPLAEGRYPAILSYGPYGKGITYQGAGKGSAYYLMWELSTQECPELLAGSSNKYQVFETLDPERWVPHGYTCVRIDSRGSGWSEGFLDVFSSRQTRDISLCIEWVASQTWSNGSIGMAGASYYALTQ